MRFLQCMLAMLSSLFVPLKADENPPVLILNMADQEILPRNFRTSLSPIRGQSDKMPSLVGLDKLHISGSGQFSQLSWKAILKAIGYAGPIFDIDLRQETHGFLNGAAISLYSKRDWGNRGKSDDTIYREELRWLEGLREQKEVIVNLVETKCESILLKTKPLLFQVRSASSEQQIMQEACSGYLRLYVTDHAAPSPEEVDKFIQFIKKLPTGAWLHFHCAAGNGRTITFMAIYDMMHNAKKVSLQDIIARQHLIGGVDLFKPSDPLHWKYPYAKAKELFLGNFFEYAKWNTDGFNTTWSLFQKQLNQHPAAL